LSSILQVASNLPYSARLGANVDLNNDGNRNSDRAPGFGRNSFHQGHFVSLDLRATKTFFFTERYRLQFMGEFFNALDPVNILGCERELYMVNGVNTPSVSLTQRVGFGDERSTFDPRIGQLALKFIF